MQKDILVSIFSIDFFVFLVLFGILCIWISAILMHLISPSIRYKNQQIDIQKRICLPPPDIIEPIRRNEKLIFEERIGGVPFRYNEQDKTMEIGVSSPDTEPIIIESGGIEDFKRFIERLEEYVEE